MVPLVIWCYHPITGIMFIIQQKRKKEKKIPNVSREFLFNELFGCYGGQSHLFLFLVFALFQKEFSIVQIPNNNHTLYNELKE